MALQLSQALSWLSIVLGVAVYLGAVAGVFFGAATPPLDVGALTFLLVGVLFGAAGLAVSGRPVEGQRQTPYGRDPYA